MNLKKFVWSYLSKNPIGFRKEMVLRYMKENNLSFEQTDEITSQVSEIMSDRVNYYSSNDMYELNGFDAIYDENILSKLRLHITRISGYCLGIQESQLDSITEGNLREAFSIFEIDDLYLDKKKIEINCHFANTSIHIKLTYKRFSIESEYANKIDSVYPFFEYLKNEGDYGYEQEGYLPLDSVSFLSFQLLYNLLKKHFDSIYVRPTEFNQTK